MGREGSPLILAWPSLWKDVHFVCARCRDVRTARSCLALLCACGRPCRPQHEFLHFCCMCACLAGCDCELCHTLTPSGLCHQNNPPHRCCQGGHLAPCLGAHPCQQECGCGCKPFVVWTCDLDMCCMTAMHAHVSDSSSLLDDMSCGLCELPEGPYYDLCFCQLPSQL